MPTNGSKVDLILDTRLTLLAQAVEEVNQVSKAMTELNDRLRCVEEFLSHNGTLWKVEGQLMTHMGDADTRLNVALRDMRDLPEARPRRMAGEPERSPHPGQTPSPLEEAADRIARATAEINALTEARRRAWESFQDVRRWSIAGLQRSETGQAAQDYKKSIEQIRADEHPWRRYEAEIPRQGYQLFDQYLELVAGMAVRGFGLDARIMADVNRLIDQLRKPIEDLDMPRGSGRRSPLTLMGSLGKRHLPLGYPEWSLWALPLVGRSVGEEFVGVCLGDSVTPRTRLLCADLYAQFVLGPSYVVAATFLDFDPNPQAVRPEVPADALRLQTLLERLPALGGGKFEGHLSTTVKNVDREWRVARSAFDGDDPVLDEELRFEADRFLQTLRKEYPDSEYPVSGLPEVKDAASQLANENLSDQTVVQGLSGFSNSLRQLICAMWLGRLAHPDKAAIIYKRAKLIASGASGSREPSQASNARGQ
ncbi:MAG TPA: hypothetical protein VGB75_11405 [Jatrophihabitans sp.]|jgi:hypothetical protein|uniref:hypothetical protein n=1 Tax=Jatrophihabitans sp. TaxID=1932789 RepID=UPI002F07E85A